MTVLNVDYTSAQAPKLFSESLKETGFAVLHNHCIDTNLIQTVYQQWQEFFYSDLSNKTKYHYQKPSQAGYFPFKTENAKNHKVSDLKEFFHVYPHGPIPSELKDNSLEMYSALQQLASKLLQWIENYLPEDVSNQLSMPLKDMSVDSDFTLLRILHYPPLPEQVADNAVRAAPHEDINLITLLPAATAPGLEVLDNKEQWHAVPCDPGNIVVNVGDMLQMCTQYHYKSTTHRVVNPNHVIENRSRFSMPLFLHPRKEVKLAENLTAIDYLHQRLREIGIY